MSKAFVELFPTPQFMSFSAIGLDISDRSVRFVELVQHGKGIALGKFAERSIDTGIIESGVIKNADALAGVLNSLAADYPITHAAVSLPEEQGYVFRLRAPVKKMSEIRGNIEQQLEENVPLPKADVTFDYDVVSEPTEKDGFYDVNVVALPNHTVLSYADVFGRTPIEPLAFEIEAQSVARAVIKGGDMDAHLVVDFGKSRTSFSVVQDGLVWYNTVTNIGGDMMTAAIQKEKDVSFEEAEKLKTQTGIVSTREGKELLALLIPSVSALKDEMMKNYIYWNTHKDERTKKKKKIMSVIICGGSANIRGLVDYLAFGFEVGVVLANPLINILDPEKDVPAMHLEDSLRFTAAFGLALRCFDSNNRMACTI